jgi:hypothetical protein
MLALLALHGVAFAAMLKMSAYTIELGQKISEIRL